jgi:hypothetical protein
MRPVHGELVYTGIPVSCRKKLNSWAGRGIFFREPADDATQSLRKCKKSNFDQEIKYVFANYKKKLLGIAHFLLLCNFLTYFSLSVV